jgi:hypothetical protein
MVAGGGRAEKDPRLDYGSTADDPASARARLSSAGRAFLGGMAYVSRMIPWSAVTRSVPHAATLSLPYS